MFFTFMQNNSGGEFVAELPFDVVVVIEADDPQDANRRAEELGIYFNGVESGYDCDCCGDRWNPLWNGEKGDAVPSMYGDPIPDDYTDWNGGATVHMKNGKVYSTWR